MLITSGSQRVKKYNFFKAKDLVSFQAHLDLKTRQVPYTVELSRS